MGTTGRSTPPQTTEDFIATKNAPMQGAEPAVGVADVLRIYQHTPRQITRAAERAAAYIQQHAQIVGATIPVDLK